MASNNLPDSIQELFTLGMDMADGLHAHKTAVGIKQNTEVAFRADLDATIAAQTAHLNAQAAKAGLSTAVTLADSNAKAFISAARRQLANYLGENYSQAWAATGFPDQSVGVPGTQAKREALLQALQTYFTANAGQENAALNVTAARAGTLFMAMADARNAAAEGNAVAGQKKNLRDAAEKTLRTRMSGLIGELGQLLDDTDPVWLAFGLNLPGATNVPDPADNLVLTAGGPGTVLADWSDASRATRYRVFKQIVGVDAAMMAVATVTDSDYTFAGLPAGKTLRVKIIAANDAGQSPASDPAQIVVP